MSSLDSNDQNDREILLEQLATTQDTLRRLRSRKVVRIALAIADIRVKVAKPIKKDDPNRQRARIFQAESLSIKYQFLDRLRRHKGLYARTKTAYGFYVRTRNTLRPGRRRESQSLSSGARKDFDYESSDTLRQKARAYYEVNPDVSDLLVSVIMPTRNRQNEIGNAIQSVLKQTHGNLELIIIDDGSSDDTVRQVEEVTASEPRVRLITQTAQGVGAARNAALHQVVGDFVTFLDSDNQWDPDFLKVLLCSAHSSKSDECEVFYTAMVNVHDDGRRDYRGKSFDHTEMRRGNIVDINSVLIRRTAATRSLFDTTLKRFNDWDYLLCLADYSRFTYLPFLGVIYNQGSSTDRISNGIPRLYRKLVETRANYSLSNSLYYALARRQIRLEQLNFEIAICIGAPRGNRHVWGDYNYAVSLKHAFERRGHQTTIVYHNEKIPTQSDIAIQLLGLCDFEIPDGCMSVGWVISHPNLHLEDLLKSGPPRYHFCFVASKSLAEMLRVLTNSDRIFYLPQCTDPNMFMPSSFDAEERHGILFVGNSRKAPRRLVERVGALTDALEIFGSGWSDRVPKSCIQGTQVHYKDLGTKYRTASLLLNDHWPAMRDFGIISNRVFDSVMAGTPVLTDDHPSIRTLFGPEVLQESDIEDFEEFVQNKVELKRVDSEVIAWIRSEHSFDARAETILETIFPPSYQYGESGSEETLAVSVPTSSPSLINSARSGTGTASRGRLVVLPQGTMTGYTSSAYIRQFLPLTSEPFISEKTLEIASLTKPVGRDMTENDCLLISRTAVSSVDDALEILEFRKLKKFKLAIDIDDALHLIDEFHPEYEIYRPRVAALEILLANADVVMTSTDKLAGTLNGVSGRVETIPNGLDPRLWRPYARTTDGLATDSSFNVLYYGTKTHQKDLELIWPVLQELGEKGQLQLILIGVTPGDVRERWVTNLSYVSGRYPDFVRRLVARRHMFGVGIAPLVEDSFNSLKSDIKLWEYTALGIPSIASDAGPYGCSDARSTLCADTADWYQALMDNRSKHESRREKTFNLDSYEVQEAEEANWRQIRTASEVKKEIIDALSATQ